MNYCRTENIIEAMEYTGDWTELKEFGGDTDIIYSLTYDKNEDGTQDQEVKVLETFYKIPRTLKDGEFIIKKTSPDGNVILEVMSSDDFHKNYKQIKTVEDYNE